PPNSGPWCRGRRAGLAPPASSAPSRRGRLPRSSRLERVVRRLRHVHVVIRMDGLMAAERLAGDPRAAVGDYLVHVHVELCTAAGHPNVQRELLLVLARRDLVADADDQVLLRVAEPAGPVV